MMFDYSYDEGREFLIQFYKNQYLKFIRIGLGGLTEHNTLVTKSLIKITEQRLDQIIKDEKTESNTCDFEKGKYNDKHFYRVPKKYCSNRSFGWDDTSGFRYLDLSLEQRNSIEYPITIQPTYIDKYTTAYRTIIDLEGEK